MKLDVDFYTAFAESKLTPKRFEHSLGVMQVMMELASVYNLDETTAMTCGILHDIAKEFSLDYQLDLARKNNISFSTEYDKHPLFLHGPVGASYIAQELGIKDPIILDTISRHSYFGSGVALSSSFCWCLRFADMLEPSRDWEDIKVQLKPLVYSGNVKDGAYLLMKWIIPFHETASVPLHPNMRRVFNELSTLMREENVCEANSLPV